MVCFCDNSTPQGAPWHTCSLKVWNSSGSQWLDKKAHPCTPLSIENIPREGQVLQLLPCNPSPVHWCSSWKPLSLSDLKLKMLPTWKEWRAFLVSPGPLKNHSQNHRRLDWNPNRENLYHFVIFNRIIIKTCLLNIFGLHLWKQNAVFLARFK